MSKESERVVDLVDRARRHQLPIEDLLTFNAAMNNAAEPLARQVEQLEASNRALIEALDTLTETVLVIKVQALRGAVTGLNLRKLDDDAQKSLEALKQAKGESDEQSQTGSLCFAASPRGRCCTREQDHSGEHIAKTFGGMEIDRWPNEN